MSKLRSIFCFFILIVGSQSFADQEKLNLTDLVDKIYSFEKLEELVKFHGNIDFQNVISSLRHEQIKYIDEHKDLLRIEAYENWCKDYALRLNRNDNEALKLDHYRLVLETFLFRVADLCFITPTKESQYPLISDRRGLVMKVGKRKIIPILSMIVGMDKYKTMIHVIDDIYLTRGINWYSAFDEDIEYSNYTGPSINKRLIWIYGIKELGLEKISSISYFLEPEELLEEGIENQVEHPDLNELSINDD